MFRCKECGCEFNIKPDYCDCGNNTFDEIQTAENYKMPDLRQLFSFLIFALCIILAIIPWTIKDKTPQQKPVVQKAKAVSTDIPDIEKIWESPPVKIETPPPIPEPAAIKEIIHPEPVKTVPTPKPQKITRPKQVTKPAPKPQQPKTINQPPKAVQQPKPVTPVQTQQKMQKSRVEPKTIKAKPVDKTPLINYKNELRIALLSNLNVPNIQGSGDCVISFGIDNSGKLLNRSFVYKSSNKSVNDEVYYMLMRVPYFKKPPEIYKGEVIKMKFYFNNGYYEISFL